ncbi:hypothetical protein [Pseudomonas capsici]|uniref:hypothetical protein n=1 Tax=Pseudomonas capsici TaxID=2810614 RepID=UPI0021F20CA0|nr:hypothetical protein [Pseudomonas capsici]MCV4340489.1 hypothetical protein [Pseudomonas capsici]
MIINISDVWSDVVAKHSMFLNSEIDKGLLVLSESSQDVAICDFIKVNRKVIVDGTPLELTSCIEDYEGRFSVGELREYVSKRLKDIFDFSEFSKKSQRPWTAYHLCLQAKYKVCCYCHMVSTGTCLPDEELKGYRPPIDHYYNKSDYPFLALTLSNFIPCCEKCNGSQMKHSVDFAKNIHLNPFVDEESIEFELHHLVVDDDMVAKALALELPSENYRLTVEAKKNHAASEASIKTFQLKNRYEAYSIQAFHLAKKMRSYAARQNMLDTVLDFSLTLSDYLEFDPDNYKDLPYGKARVCIARQYGAISE